MNTRKMPESPLSPEFIKVAYDKHGNAIGVSPVDMKVNDQNSQNGNDQIKQNFAPKTIPQPIEEWLSLISKNVIALKRDVENTQNLYAQITQQIQQINQISPVVNLSPVENGIYETNHRIDSINKKIDAIPVVNLSPLENGIDSANQRIDEINQKMVDFNFQMKEQNTMYTLLADQVNVMNEIVASVAKEFANQQTANRQLSEKIESLNEQLNGNFVTLKQIMQDIDLNSSNFDSSTHDIDERIASMHKQLAASIERTEGNIVALNELVSQLSSKTADIENSNFDIRVEIENDLRNMKTELMQTIENSKIDREALVNEIIERAKILRKYRKPKVIVKIKVRKPRKIKHRKIKHKTHKAKPKIVKKARKINRNILAKKLMKADIATYPSALIVTERKMQRIGRVVFDVAKKMNKNVLMIMQDKVSESDGFEPVTYDAMVSSDAIFIVTKKNMKKNFSLKTVKANKPVFIVNQKIKFSKLN